MANESRKTTSVVRLNAKPTAYNLEHIADGGVNIAEGRLFVETNGVAALAGAASQFVWLNWLDTEAGSVRDSVTNVFDQSSPTINLDAGGLAGIIGNGIPIGLHTSEWDINGTPAVGDLVIVGATGKPKNVTFGAIAATLPYFGVVYRISEDVIWFLFESVARVTG
jgi:hypothetical protein